MKTIELSMLANVIGGAGEKPAPTKCKGIINNCGNVKNETTNNTNNGGVQVPVTASPQITVPFPGAPE